MLKAESNEAERDLLLRLYCQVKLPASKISRQLHISERTLYRKLDKYGIPRRTHSEANYIRYNSMPYLEKLKSKKELIEKLYWQDGLSLSQIGKKLGRATSTIRHFMAVYGIPRRDESKAMSLIMKAKGERGPTARSWRGGVFEKDGYVHVYNPEHPRADKRGYVLEHILVWEETNGRPLPDGWVIHHLNGIKNDNRPSNLVAMPRKAHYLVLEEKAKRIRELEIEVRQLRRALEDSQLIFYISEN